MQRLQVHDTLALIEPASNEGSGEFAHMRILAWAFTARKRKV